MDKTMVQALRNLWVPLDALLRGRTLTPEEISAAQMAVEEARDLTNAAWTQEEAAQPVSHASPFGAADAFDAPGTFKLTVWPALGGKFFTTSKAPDRTTLALWLLTSHDGANQPTAELGKEFKAQAEALLSVCDRWLALRPSTTAPQGAKEQAPSEPAPCSAGYDCHDPGCTDYHGFRKDEFTP